MQFLFENAVLVGVVGAVLTGLTAFAGGRLSDRRLLLGSAALLMVTILLVAISIAIETDREQLKRTMREIASAVEQNQHEKVFSYFHPNASLGVQHAKSEVPRYRFHQASVTSVRSMTLNPRTNPPSAITEFIAAFKVSSDRPDAYGADFNSRRFVKVYWMKHQDRWLVHDYEHSDFMQGFTNRNGIP